MNLIVEPERKCVLQMIEKDKGDMKDKNKIPKSEEEGIATYHRRADRKKQ